MRMLGRIYLNILESIVNNNLWKELAEQADAYAYAKIGMSFDYHPDWHGVRDEKFAELIVRECMRMCDVADMCLLEHNCVKEASGTQSAKDFIKEHFGVEE